jgi:hypothetical protein
MVASWPRTAEHSIIHDYSFDKIGQLQVAVLSRYRMCSSMLLSLLVYDDCGSLFSFFQNSLKKFPLIRVDKGQFARSISLLCFVVMRFCDGFANRPGKLIDNAMSDGITKTP